MALEWLSDVVPADCRSAVRQLRKSPILTMMVVASLSVGVGVSALLFGFLTSLLYAPVPGITESGLVVLYSTNARVPGTYRELTHGLYERFRSVGLLDSLAGFAPMNLSFRAPGGLERISAASVTDDYFGLLGVRPALGSLIGVGTATDSVVLSYDLWQRHFVGRNDAIDARVALNGRPMTVVGVAPRSFHGIDYVAKLQVWLPLAAHWDVASGRFFYGSDEPPRLFGVGRLARDAALGQLRARAKSLGKQFWADEPRAADQDVELFTLDETTMGVGRRWETARYPLLLWGGVCSVLLLACLSFANVFLARVEGRLQELGLRLCLGAGSGALARLLLVEATLTALLAGAGGAILYWLARPLLRQVRLPGEAVVPMTTNAEGLLFTILATLLVGMLLGLGPALATRRLATSGLLRETTAAGSRRRWRNILVLTQVAVSFIVVICAGLLARSARNLQHAETGFEPTNVLTASVDLDIRGFDPPRALAFLMRLKDVLDRDPRVANVSAMAGARPLGVRGIAVPILRPGFSDKPELSHAAIVTADYFRTLGIALRQGRVFGPQDGGGPAAAVVSETFARRFFPTEDPIGQHVHSPAAEEPFEVIGVVADGNYRTLREAARPFLYLSAQQYEKYRIASLLVLPTLLLRTDDDPESVVPTLRDAVRSLEASIPLFDVSTLAHLHSKGWELERQAAAAFAGFGTVALSLALLGVFGLVSFSAAQRNNEMGIRLALGARPVDLLNSLARQGVGYTILGIAVGLAAFLSLQGLIAPQLYGTQPLDWQTLSLTTLGILLSGAVASMLPGLRAAAVDPADLLRRE